jgi:hypothetical protein
MIDYEIENYLLNTFRDKFKSNNAILKHVAKYAQEYIKLLGYHVALQLWTSRSVVKDEHLELAVRSLQMQHSLKPLSVKWLADARKFVSDCAVRVVKKTPDAEDTAAASGGKKKTAVGKATTNTKVSTKTKEETSDSEEEEVPVKTKTKVPTKAKVETSDSDSEEEVPVKTKTKVPTKTKVETSDSDSEEEAPVKKRPPPNKTRPVIIDDSD